MTAMLSEGRGRAFGMKRTIEFLTSNMKEMEIELRAQSIALEALGAGLVELADMQDALRMARSSESMLTFVEQKYHRLRQLLPKIEEAKSEEEVAKLLEAEKPSGYMQ